MDFKDLEKSAKCRSKWMQCDACGKWRRLSQRATTLDPVTGQEKVDGGYVTPFRDQVTILACKSVSQTATLYKCSPTHVLFHS